MSRDLHLRDQFLRNEETLERQRSTGGQKRLNIINFKNLKKNILKKFEKTFKFNFVSQVSQILQIKHSKNVKKNIKKSKKSKLFVRIYVKII